MGNTNSNTPYPIPMGNSNTPLFPRLQATGLECFCLFKNKIIKIIY